MQSREPEPRVEEEEQEEEAAAAAAGAEREEAGAEKKGAGQAWPPNSMEIEKEFHRMDEADSWAAIYQDIRHEASDFPCKVAKFPKNKNRNRYRDVSPCKYSIALKKIKSDTYYWLPVYWNFVARFVHRRFALAFVQGCENVT
uniref:protein-tyrosine-phosphatase n=1 Tax=Anolis carolinensis TaxID=28377 RepID=A0A803SL07_ANOCA